MKNIYFRILVICICSQASLAIAQYTVTTPATEHVHGTYAFAYAEDLTGGPPIAASSVPLATWTRTTTARAGPDSCGATSTAALVYRTTVDPVDGYGVQRILTTQSSSANFTIPNLTSDMIYRPHAKTAFSFVITTGGAKAFLYLRGNIRYSAANRHRFRGGDAGIVINRVTSATDMREIDGGRLYAQQVSDTEGAEVLLTPNNWVILSPNRAYRVTAWTNAFRNVRNQVGDTSNSSVELSFSLFNLESLAAIFAEQVFMHAPFLAFVNNPQALENLTAEDLAALFDEEVSSSLCSQNVEAFCHMELNEVNHHCASAEQEIACLNFPSSRSIVNGSFPPASP